MSHDARSGSERLVGAAPTLAATGAVLMPVIGVALYDRLSAVDRAAFAIDAVGYAVAIAPLRQRRVVGWRLLTVLTAIQPLFSLAKQIEGTGSRLEAIGRAGGTAVVLGLLLRLRKFYR